MESSHRHPVSVTGKWRVTLTGKGTHGARAHSPEAKRLPGLSPHHAPALGTPRATALLEDSSSQELGKPRADLVQEPTKSRMLFKEGDSAGFFYNASPAWYPQGQEHRASFDAWMEGRGREKGRSEGRKRGGREGRRERKKGEAEGRREGLQNLPGV